MSLGNCVTKNEEVPGMVERDHVFSEGNNSVNVRTSGKETGDEDGIARDKEIEKDIISQEEEMEQLFETHSDTGVCILHSSEDDH